MILHPALWHSVRFYDNQPQEQQQQQQQYSDSGGGDGGGPVVAADLPWFVTPHGMILVPVLIPKGQKPPVTMPVPSFLPYRWQLVEYMPREDPAALALAHIVCVDPNDAAEEGGENFCPVIFCDQIGAPAPALSVGPDQNGKWLFVYSTVQDVMSASQCMIERGKTLKYVTSMITAMPAL